MKAFSIFPGNCPHNVSKDAKYTVRGSDGRIALIYRTANDERWHLSTREHPELAEMVNEVKLTYGSAANGPFYINEYKQVIVPVGGEATYYLAGTYNTPLQFEFDGKVISGEPRNLEGEPLRPGDIWVGPHAGIPYILVAAGNDIYYKIFPRLDVEKRVKLSSERGRSVAEQVARMLSAFKGSGGGRFYVNEFCSVFSPINGREGLEYLYIGQLDLGSWFPNPVGSGTTDDRDDDLRVS
jgi:hypothetical protein